MRIYAVKPEPNCNLFCILNVGTSLYNQITLIRILWVMVFIFIPLLSIYGRGIQMFLRDNLSTTQFTAITAIVLLALCIKAVYWLIKKHALKKIWHLGWFIPLFFILPFFMPIIEERVHFIVFGSFGFLSMLIFSPRIAIAICLAVSALDEGLQWHLPDRVGDWADIAINTLASLGAAAIVYITWKKDA